MSGNEIIGILIAVGVLAVLLALAIRFTFRGGKVNLKAGTFEGTFDATMTAKINAMHTSLSEINRAVNHQAAGEPTLIETVKTLQGVLDAHVEQTAGNFNDINAHVAASLVWQARIEESLKMMRHASPLT